MSNSDMTNRQVCCDVKPGYQVRFQPSLQFTLCDSSLLRCSHQDRRQNHCCNTSSIIKLKQLNLFFSLVGELSEFITLGTQEQEHKKLLLVAPGSLYLRADGRRTNSSTSGRSDPAKINQPFTEYVHR